MITALVHYFLGNAVSKIIHVALLVWLAAKLQPEGFGEFSIFLSSSMVLMIVLTLNFHSATGRYCYEKDASFENFLITQTLLILIVYITIGSILYILINFFDFHVKIINKYVLLGGLFIVAEIISSIYFQVLQSRRLSRKNAVYGVTRSALAVAGVLTSIGYYDQISSHTVVIGYVIGYSMPALLVVMCAAGSNQFGRPEREHIKYIGRYAGPLFFYTLSGIFILHADRLMVSSLIGIKAAGVYSFAATVALGSLLVVNTVLSAWTPRYFKYMNRASFDHVRQDISGMLSIAGFVAVLSIFIGSALLPFILPSEYTVGMLAILVLGVGYFCYLGWQLYGRHLGYFHKTGYVGLIGLCGSVLNIFLNWSLIPKFGLIGAASSTAFVYCFMVVLAYHVTKIKVGFVPLSLGIFFQIFGYIILSLLLAHVVSYFTAGTFKLISHGVMAVILSFDYCSRFGSPMKNFKIFK